jgi:hypothetical protein
MKYGIYVCEFYIFKFIHVNLRALAADSQLFSLYLGNKTIFYFPKKNTSQ